MGITLLLWTQSLEVNQRGDNVSEMMAYMINHSDPHDDLVMVLS